MLSIYAWSIYSRPLATNADSAISASHQDPYPQRARRAQLSEPNAENSCSISLASRAPIANSRPAFFQVVVKMSDPQPPLSASLSYGDGFERKYWAAPAGGPDSGGLRWFALGRAMGVRLADGSPEASTGRLYVAAGWYDLDCLVLDSAGNSAAGTRRVYVYESEPRQAAGGRLDLLAPPALPHTTALPAALHAWRLEADGVEGDPGSWRLMEWLRAPGRYRLTWLVPDVEHPDSDMPYAADPAIPAGSGPDFGSGSGVAALGGVEVVAVSTTPGYVVPAAPPPPGLPPPFPRVRSPGDYWLAPPQQGDGWTDTEPQQPFWDMRAHVAQQGPGREETTAEGRERRESGVQGKEEEAVDEASVGGGGQQEGLGPGVAAVLFDGRVLLPRNPAVYAYWASPRRPAAEGGGSGESGWCPAYAPASPPSRIASKHQAAILFLPSIFSDCLYGDEDGRQRTYTTRAYGQPDAYGRTPYILDRWAGASVYDSTPEASTARLYGKSGWYNVTCRVQDSAGRLATGTRRVYVYAATPRAALGGWPTLLTGPGTGTDAPTPATESLPVTWADPGLPPATFRVLDLQIQDSGLGSGFPYGIVHGYLSARALSPDPAADPGDPDSWSLATTRRVDFVRRQGGDGTTWALAPEDATDPSHPADPNPQPGSAISTFKLRVPGRYRLTWTVPDPQNPDSDTPYASDPEFVELLVRAQDPGLHVKREQVLEKVVKARPS
eukprot:XP_001703099.1 predicted protein [Chlamydomonas reinhardtii]